MVPLIAPCGTKEPDFFSSDKNWRKGIEWYEQLWNWIPGQHECALEGSPLYTSYPHVPGVPERMKSTGREFRFIYIVRHPIERIESHITFDVAKGRIDLRRSRSAVPKYRVDFSRYPQSVDKSSRRSHGRVERLAMDGPAGVKVPYLAGIITS
jgi:hypothetical protein